MQSVVYHFVANFACTRH